jgi:hypothetical protein
MLCDSISRVFGRARRVTRRARKREPRSVRPPNTERPHANDSRTIEETADACRRDQLLLKKLVVVCLVTRSGLA